MKKVVFLLFIIIAAISPIAGMVESTEEFLQAAREGDIDTVKNLLMHDKFLVNAQDEEGNTALMIAVQKNYIKMAQELVHMGASISTGSNRGPTPLMLAIKAKNLDMINMLLDNAKIFSVFIDDRDKEGNSPLELAIKTGDINIIRAILNEVPKIKRKGKTIMALIQETISDEKVKNEIIKLLPFAENQYNLYDAIRKDKDKADIEKYIISKDVFKISSNRNPLSVAISTNELEIVKLLVERGADVNQVFKDGLTPLMVAIISAPLLPTLHRRIIGHDKAKIISFLLEQGAAPNLYYKKIGTTPLIRAAALGDFDVVQELLAYGADPSIKNSKGKTALDMAQKKFENLPDDLFLLSLKKNYENIIKLLKDHQLLSALQSLTQKLNALQTILNKK